MNRFFTFICIFAFLGFNTIIYAQPQVSYIIPDIGAPAMNTYVEFIAPQDAKWTFGLDGLYLNNVDDRVRVVAINPDDKAKVKIGPVIVSWSGRVISTQIFINPELKPNSTDALSVRPEFRIPLVVVVDGLAGNEQVFYIVNPRPFFDGTQNTGEKVFGAGSLGTRSPRGAMIFDSLKLADGTYTVSTSDCDPSTIGNQGYLPFTLIVKGKISGSSNTVLSGDANRKNGGPGGGGGGGRFYDAFLFGLNEIGDDGGAGFVGGGAGGRNRNGFGIDDAFKNTGVGTGAGGSSMNGISAPANQAYESAAGGTGHPFGTSGTSCSDGNNCTPDGGYGGGSGRSQNTQGGSAGYSIAGVGPSAGKVVGNIMNVPLAGGSGGASGNPNFPGAFSGNGGGGGGAITICAGLVENLKVISNGAPGESPSGGVGNVSFGGSGSGGMINLMSKSNIRNSTVEVSGGSVNNRSGGSGRIRLDYNWQNDDVAINTSGVELYYGLRTDTTQYVGSGYDYLINRNQHKPGKNITSRVYLAPFGKDWELVGQMHTDPINFTQHWHILDKTEKYHCYVFIQDVPNYNQNEYVAEPQFVMSQAAANLLILELNPILIADSIAENKAITCIGFERTIETVIKNDKAAGTNLKFDATNSNWIFGNNGFEIVEPLGEINIKPGDSIILKVKYQYTGGDKTNISNRLFIKHNDPNKKDPWIIEFRVGDAFLPGMKLEGNFDFGEVRIGGKSSKSYQLKNLGEAPLRIESINPINPPFYVVGTTPNLPVILKPNESLSIQVEFRPTAEQDYSSSLSAISIVTDSTCSSFAFEQLKGKGVFSSIDINTTEIDFGIIPWCDEKQEIISIKNPSSATSSFTLTSEAEITGDNPEAFIITNPKIPPVTITPGDGTQFNIKINGKQAGTGIKTAKFTIKTDVPETPEIEVILKAEIVGFEVVPGSSPINLGNVDRGYEIKGVINLRNNGKSTERLKSVSSNNQSSFTFSNVAGDEILPGDVYNINYTLNTKSSPLNNQIIIAFDFPCNDTIVIPVNLNYIDSKLSARSSSQNFFSDLNKVDTLDFGKFSPCLAGSLKLIEFVNNSQARYTVLDEDITNLTNLSFFKVGSGLTYPDTIIGGDSKNAIQIFFEPKDLDEGTYYGEYIAKVYINAIETNYRIVLKAEVIRGKFNYSPSSHNFSEVVGLTSEFEFEIENEGPYNLEIIGFSQPTHIEFKSLENLIGTKLSDKEKKKFKVTFSPSSVTKYNDSIVIRVVFGGCEEDFVIYLIGDGLPSKKLHIYIPNMIVEPTLTNFKIPILGKLDKFDDILDEFVIDSIKISMRRSMFYPEKIIGGTLINSNLVNEDRVLTLKLDNINISRSDSIVAEIEGSTLLGDTDFTDIRISELFYSMKVLVGEVTTENGSMKTEICNEGGDRLLQIQGSGNSVAVSPNPANDLINISVKSIEKGKYSISLIDALGKELQISEWENTESGQITINYQSIGLNSGSYNLILKTPTEVLVTLILIIK